MFSVSTDSYIVFRHFYDQSLYSIHRAFDGMCTVVSLQYSSRTCRYIYYYLSTEFHTDFIGTFMIYLNRIPLQKLSVHSWCISIVIHTEIVCIFNNISYRFCRYVHRIIHRVFQLIKFRHQIETSVQPLPCRLFHIPQTIAVKSC